MSNQAAAVIMDGKAVAEKIRAELKVEVDEFVARGKRRPGLAVVLIGEDPASHIYVKNKILACKKAGIESFERRFPVDVALDDVMDCLSELNADPLIDGILVQLPLPKHLPTDQILMHIAAQKDADGLHPHNLGLLVAGRTGPRPCTPLGVMELLRRSNVEIAGSHAVVIGRSNLVGKPVSLMLQEKHATVTMCHSKTKDLDELCRSADILVVAAGRAEMVRGSWIKPGAVVVDVGIHRIELPSGEGKIVGDVAFDEAAPIASRITPVPGGIGPMTIAMLLSNTVAAYRRHGDV
jgi:methylenetetrahydrofolate dehydrogenase (NADP+) / methenyltetrahydrofolate cyclohydrolase